MEYNQAVQSAVSESPALRVGQAFFNVLHDTRPDLAGVVAGTEDDPFYSDARIPGFLAFIRERWHQGFHPAGHSCRVCDQQIHTQLDTINTQIHN